MRFIFARSSLMKIPQMVDCWRKVMLVYCEFEDLDLPSRLVCYTLTRMF